MTNQELLTHVLESGAIINGRLSPNATAKLQDVQLYDALVGATAFLGNTSIQARLYALTHNLTAAPVCCECSKPVKFLTPAAGFRKFCSKACQGASLETKAKRASTNVIRFGIENPLLTPAAKQKAAASAKKSSTVEKRKQTCLAKYGVEFSSQSNEVKKRKANTNLQRYGTSSSIQSEQAKKKTAQTMQARYGADTYFGSKTFRNNITEYFQKKYGASSYMGTTEFREKSAATLLENHGVTNPSFSSDVMRKIAAARRETSKISEDTYQKLNSIDWLTKQNHELKKPLTAIADTLGDVTHKTVWNYFQTHNVPVMSHAVSRGEIELQDFIESLGVDIVKHERSILDGKEIDIFVPSCNLGIEFNGAYWHSASKKHKAYHLDKFITSRSKGVHLLQVFDYVWVHRKDIVKTKIKTLLGLGTQIPAIDCDVCELTEHEYYSFVTANHFPGPSGETICVGLYYLGTLVAVMGLAECTTKGSYELTCYCSSEPVTGGAEKLFSQFINTCQPATVKAVADRNWCQGDLYLGLGFVDVTEDYHNINEWFVTYGHDSYQIFKEEKEGALKIHGAGTFDFEWTRP